MDENPITYSEVEIVYRVIFVYNCCAREISAQTANPLGGKYLNTSPLAILRSSNSPISVCCVDLVYPPYVCTGKYVEHSFYASDSSLWLSQYRDTISIMIISLTLISARAKTRKLLVEDPYILAFLYKCLH